MRRLLCRATTYPAPKSTQMRLRLVLKHSCNGSQEQQKCINAQMHLWWLHNTSKQKYICLLQVHNCICVLLPHCNGKQKYRHIHEHMHLCTSFWWKSLKLVCFAHSKVNLCTSARKKALPNALNSDTHALFTVHMHLLQSCCDAYLLNLKVSGFIPHNDFSTGIMRVLVGTLWL